jgi:genome maintenance exonuclease 1
MKTFKHNLVEKVSLTREHIDGKRYYVLPNSNYKFRSVTTVLGEKLDKSGLVKWREKVGEEEAKKIMVQAANRGTAVHNICERYILNEKNYSKGEMPSNVVSFRVIQKALDENVNNIYGIELPLYSKALMVAGTSDLIAEYKGKVSVIDFKTSKRLKDENWIEGYFLQSTLYSMMFERLYEIKCEQIVIIIVCDDEPEAQIFVKDRSQYVNRVLEVFTL